jgi:hypothetical protein
MPPRAAHAWRCAHWLRRSERAATAARTQCRAETARRTGFALARDIHLQHAPRHALTVELAHRGIAVLVRHLDEAEAARPARLSILDQYHFTDRAVLLEDFAYTLFVERERKISNVELCHFRIQA